MTRKGALPFALNMAKKEKPKLNVAKAAPVNKRPASGGAAPKSEVSARGKKLSYSADVVYTQLGTANRAFNAARLGFRRLATAVSHMEGNEQAKASGLVERIHQILNSLQQMEEELVEFQAVMMKFKMAATVNKAVLVDSAFGQVRAALQWYERMLQAHTLEDRDDLIAMADQLRSITARLGEVRKEKVEAAVSMEQQHNKTARAIGANLTRPVKQKQYPYPTNVPGAAIDPKELVVSDKELSALADWQVRAKDTFKAAKKDGSR